MGSLSAKNFSALSDSVPLCRQFWKAGEYEVGSAFRPSTQNSQNRLRVHPKFLHSNATSHKWAFGAGYIPNTELVLQDVAEGDKKESLLYHSQRLALAYGLISTKSIHPIRIFKNLRICGDCHNAIKFMSSITRREFIIRDASRFHHFQHGYCSCQDYW